MKKINAISVLTIMLSLLLITKVDAITYEDCMLVAKTKAEKANCQNIKKETECIQNGYKNCAENEKEADCEQASLSEFDSSFSCEDLDIARYDREKEREAEREAECQKKYQKKYKTKNKISCAEYAELMRTKSGQGFKVPLNFLTLKGKDGKRQGESIFQNKKYAEHGVFIGTLLRVIDILVYVIGSVALLTLIAGGIFMIANHGDEAWVTKGKDMMFYSILGLLFALLSFVFVNAVTSILS